MHRLCQCLLHHDMIFLFVWQSYVPCNVFFIYIQTCVEYKFFSLLCTLIDLCILLHNTMTYFHILTFKVECNHLWSTVINKVHNNISLNIKKDDYIWHQVLASYKHKNVGGLNQLMGCLPCPLEF